MDLNLIRMSDIQEKQVDWLWRPYIPCGKITIIQGDPGEGKRASSYKLASLHTSTTHDMFFPSRYGGYAAAEVPRKRHRRGAGAAPRHTDFRKKV